jgi:hypothetical protein
MQPDHHEAKAARDVHAMLGELESFDRVCTLLAAVLDYDRGAVQQVKWLAAVIETMGKRLPESERVALASVLIDSAMRLVCRWH